LQGIYVVSLWQKKGVFKNICVFWRIYIFRVVSREEREGGEGGKGWEEKNREIRQLREQESQSE